MNMMAALNAVPIHAPSSTPMPMWPLRSATPSESKRVASVEMPAPMITVRMPSTGLWDRSAGSADASARVASGGVKAPVLATAVMDMVARSVLAGLRSNRDDRRQSCSQPRRQRRVVERNLDRHTLHNLGEVAGRVVRRQEGKLRSAGRCDLEHASVHHF